MNKKVEIKCQNNEIIYEKMVYSDITVNISLKYLNYF